MHEMRLHGEGLACIMVLAWVMEVILHEPIRGAVMGEHAALAHVHLNRMPVVEDALGVRAPVYFELKESRFERGGDVDGRLLPARGADSVRGVDIPPVLGTFGAFITPMQSRSEKGARA